MGVAIETQCSHGSLTICKRRLVRSRCVPPTADRRGEPVDMSELASPARTLRVDADRLLRRLMELGAIGAIPGTDGCARLALTDEDRAGRDLVLSWMHELGLQVSIDGIGNVVGVMRHPDGHDWAAPPVMTG